MSTTSSYYDIDAILAEEELIPVKNLLDFNHLAHIDPDYTHHQPITPNSKEKGRTRGEVGAGGDHAGDLDTGIDKIMSQHNHLKENTRFKMPLWSIDKWAELGFVRISLPRHFGKKARERLDADPVSVDLRRKSERFYMSGIQLVNLIQKCYRAFGGTNASRRNPHTAEMKQLMNESLELKKCLLLSYTGARLRRTFDWTLSNIEDDVSSYTSRLSEMERQLFERGAAASRANMMWKMYGSRRIHVSETALRANSLVDTKFITAQTPSKGAATTGGLGGRNTATTFGRPTSSHRVTPDGRRGDVFSTRKRQRTF